LIFIQQKWIVFQHLEISLLHYTVTIMYMVCDLKEMVDSKSVLVIENAVSFSHGLAANVNIKVCQN